MPQSLNRVSLIGNLGRDTEVRTTPAGKSVASLSLATTERWKDAEGNLKSETTWHQIEAWGSLAEIMGKLGTKGRLVYLEGRLKLMTWTDKEEQERSRTIIVADTFKVLDSKPGEEDQVADGPVEEPATEAPAPRAAAAGSRRRR